MKLSKKWSFLVFFFSSSIIEDRVLLQLFKWREWEQNCQTSFFIGEVVGDFCFFSKTVF